MAIALVQSTLKLVTGTASTTIAFTSNLTAGNFITTAQAGFAGSSLAATPTTPTDTLTHTYAGARAAYAPVNVSSQGRIFYVATIPTGGADTVTIGQANSGDFTMVIAEWSGGHATVPLGAAGEQNESTGTGTAVSAGSTGTLAQADEMILAWVTHLGNDTTMAEDAADGFSVLQENEGGSADMPLGVQYKITAATTAITVNWTLGASRNWFAQEVTFVAAAGGGGGTKAKPPMRRPWRVWNRRAG